jgi:potassium-dependent mechanosensitive channel
LRYFFDFKMTIGRLNISIKGIVLAIVIIFITQLAVRVGRELLKEKILDKQSLERGLQDSILTITSYLGWGLGLILALGTLGVNATSLAVIFGALSIGIGFGLQNIFNNFISGLILLFERPIQVGDYVEVGGLWAEVKKINVRATVVQTFDNASVIIPNSEFISQQVTNWSFKDKRMRRNLNIGVAYGSDIDLVQKTLMEIALKTSGVLKYPRPDVLFIDHGDSALIFRLRIWVHVDDYYTVPSQIRCDIDRRFRELAIEIAFPQRDLHIRTFPGQTAPIASPADSTSVQPKFEGES